MQFASQPTVAMFVIGIALASATIGSPATPANGAGPLTGKERLGEKWNDEQRTDNCKVPTDKRGTRQRTDSCAHTPTE